MLDDLRYAVRLLLKNPSVTIIAIFALALGIGANTAIFSVINAVLLRPLPYPDAGKLIVLREHSHTFERGAVGYMNWLDWHAGQKSFTDLALVRREAANFSLGSGVGSPDRLRGLRASSGFLSVMGLKPKIGRDLTAADDIAGAPNVALISENLWRKHFAGSPSVLGRRALINGLEREIIGVFPAELQFGRNPDVLLPLSEIANEPWMRNRDNHQGFWALGRLKPGVTMSQAMSDLNAIAIDLEKKYPQTNTGRRVTMRPLFETTVGDYRASLNLLLAAVVCVLLIACANVANLQFARALARSRELAMRAALGASRWAIARQLLIESTLLAVIGAIAGVFLTLWSMDAILALTPPRLPRFHEAKIDMHVLAFTTFAALLAGVLVGVWPAWRISNSKSLSLALHEAGGRSASDGPGRQRMRSGLVITQVALAIVLLAGAGLTLKSFWHAENAPLGFDPHGVVNFEISLPDAKYKTDGAEGRVLDATVAARAEHSWRRSRRRQCEQSIRRHRRGQLFPRDRHAAGSARPTAFGGSQCRLARLLPPNGNADSSRSRIWSGGFAGRKRSFALDHHRRVVRAKIFCGKRSHWAAHRRQPDS